MALSVKKKASLERKARVREVDVRSLNGRGYFMDAHDDADAKKYIETGDAAALERLPDYRKIRQAAKQ